MRGGVWLIILRGMKKPVFCVLVGLVACGGELWGAEPMRALRSLDSGDFHMVVPETVEAWELRRKEIRDRVALAAGLFPMPEKTPLNAVVHGRVERDDYTIDRVFFESYPGHFVTGSLYLPKVVPASMPGILCPHGHWKNGRFMHAAEDTGHRAVEAQIASGAEVFESAARSPLQARCVQLARMGCAVFHYDTLGTADSMQIPDHRSGARDHLKGKVPGHYGLYSAAAELRLQTNFGLQTYNSVRALDFIETVPGVDPKRLGVTGASGGATQTMMLTAVDDRVAAAFPCVMTSTSMQGGCTCENAPYLRIGQGNVDIAAATAPRPLGVTAADDWTIELETKGFPELTQLYRMLGKPDNLTGVFATQFKHNYNHVSRTAMYGFFNRHFGLGLDVKEPVLERDFVFSTPGELTVWTEEHPAPSGAETGEAHEVALLKRWAELSEAAVASQRETVEKEAWAMMIGRSAAEASGAEWVVSKEWEDAGRRWMDGEAQLATKGEVVPVRIVSPEDWKGRVVLWLREGEPEPKPGHLDKLLEAGVAVVLPDLYLRGAARAPSVNPEAETAPNSWKAAACYTYGYNPSVFARRVHDVLTVTAAVRGHFGEKMKELSVLGTDGGGVVALAAAGLMREDVDQLAVDTEGFRFAEVESIWDVNFMPGAVKYGDVPALLRLSDHWPVSVAGEAVGPKGTGRAGLEELIADVISVRAAE